MTPEERALRFIRERSTYTRELHVAVADVIRAAENDALERAAAKAKRAFGGPAHTYASENADVYRAQDTACERIAKLILALKHPDPPAS